MSIRKRVIAEYNGIKLYAHYNFLGRKTGYSVPDTIGCGSWYSVRERRYAFLFFRNLIAQHKRTHCIICGKWTPHNEICEKCYDARHKTFRVDVGNHFYLLLDAPTMNAAREWSKTIPESQDIITISESSEQRRQEYIGAGFVVSNYKIPLMEEIG